MSSPERIHFVVESGPLLDACKDWKARYVAHRVAAANLVRAKGATRIYFTGFDNSMAGLDEVERTPQGWQRKKIGRSGETVLLPAKGPKGDAARAELAALPPAPLHGEIAKLIGHPCGVNFTLPDKETYSEMMGLHIHPVQIYWSKLDDGQILITAPDADAWVAKIEEQYPNATITIGRWTPPEGLRRRSNAEKDMIIAQENLEAEQRVAAAKTAAETAPVAEPDPAPTLVTTQPKVARHRP
jgi:hypothetical protein